ncbi:thioredoxin domain-containing protein [Bacillota bacterium LX-D]|nr:thioredoxin domain-containing protein [Bacillota bacterium LX-D]
MTDHKYTNKLINEKSPYLLQHAHNPVDWYSWGEEAFEKAKREDKPVFLSIGYSTCHWCHVMERESFEDEEVAKVLNENFISIKVDREERPDIDTIYMTVCQALTGQGGWPLTIIMTPDKKPFFAGTYFPKNSRYRMPGLMEILQNISSAWDSKREQLVESSEKITTAVNTQMFTHRTGELDEKVLDRAYNYFVDAFDPEYGGFSSSPKFPIPHNLFFLLRYWKLTGEKNALAMVEKTLESMYRGGIYDHIGFGFARYSTDNKWLVPHFEKMLYDNALLAIAFGETYLATKKPFYARVVKEIFTYVLRDMTSPEGAFYSAEDADSEGVEGKFYVWDPREIETVLGPALGSDFCALYDITSEGNFEGKSIPNLINAGITDKFQTEREKLFAYREKRIHPHKDDKILTAWNGLMIAALAFNSRVLEDPGYARAAEKASAFLTKNLIRKDGRLLARYRDGEAAYAAYVDDYAFFIWGLIELYQATFKTDYLELALKLTADLLKLFWDEKEGGFYQYGSDSEELIGRPKELYDGALPSGNSVAALNLLRLSHLTGNGDLEAKAHNMFKVFGGNVASSPYIYTQFLTAVFFADKAAEVVIIGDPQSKDVQSMLSIINSNFTPEIVLMNSPENADPELPKLLPALAERKAIQGKATAYFCQNYTCQQPTTEPGKLAELLQLQI